MALHVNGGSYSYGPMVRSRGPVGRHIPYNSQRPRHDHPAVVPKFDPPELQPDPVVSGGSKASSLWGNVPTKIFSSLGEKVKDLWGSVTGSCRRPRPTDTAAANTLGGSSSFFNTDGESHMRAQPSSPDLQHQRPIDSSALQPQRSDWWNQEHARSDTDSNASMGSLVNVIKASESWGLSKEAQQKCIETIFIDQFKRRPFDARSTTSVNLSGVQHLSLQSPSNSSRYGRGTTGARGIFRNHDSPSGLSVNSSFSQHVGTQLPWSRTIGSASQRYGKGLIPPFSTSATAFRRTQTVPARQRPTISNDNAFGRKRTYKDPSIERALKRVKTSHTHNGLGAFPVNMNYKDEEKQSPIKSTRTRLRKPAAAASDFGGLANSSIVSLRRSSTIKRKSDRSTLGKKSQVQKVAKGRDIANTSIDLVITPTPLKTQEKIDLTKDHDTTTCQKEEEEEPSPLQPHSKMPPEANSKDIFTPFVIGNGDSSGSTKDQKSLVIGGSTEALAKVGAVADTAPVIEFSATLKSGSSAKKASIESAGIRFDFPLTKSEDKKDVEEDKETTKPPVFPIPSSNPFGLPQKLTDDSTSKEKPPHEVEKKPVENVSFVCRLRQLKRIKVKEEYISRIEEIYKSQCKDPDKSLKMEKALKTYKDKWHKHKKDHDFYLKICEKYNVKKPLDEFDGEVPPPASDDDQDSDNEPKKVAPATFSFSTASEIAPLSTKPFSFSGTTTDKFSSKADSTTSNPFALKATPVPSTAPITQTGAAPLFATNGTTAKAASPKIENPFAIPSTVPDKPTAAVSNPFGGFAATSSTTKPGLFTTSTTTSNNPFAPKPTSSNGTAPGVFTSVAGIATESGAGSSTATKPTQFNFGGGNKAFPSVTSSKSTDGGFQFSTTSSQGQTKPTGFNFAPVPATQTIGMDTSNSVPATSTSNPFGGSSQTSTPNLFASAAAPSTNAGGTLGGNSTNPFATKIPNPFAPSSGTNNTKPFQQQSSFGGGTNNPFASSAGFGGGGGGNTFSFKPSGNDNIRFELGTSGLPGRGARGGRRPMGRRRRR